MLRISIEALFLKETGKCCIVPSKKQVPYYIPTIPVCINVLIYNMRLLNSQPDTDILMCVTNGSLSGHYYASGRSTPSMTNPVSTVFLFYSDNIFWWRTHSFISLLHGSFKTSGFIYV